MKKEFFIAFILYLTITDSYCQTEERSFKDMILKAAKKLDKQLDMNQIIPFDNRHCDIILLNRENKYDALKTYSDPGNDLCIFSQEEIFLYNVSKYIEIVDYSVKSKTSFIELFLVETSTMSSPPKKTKYEFKFKKKRGKWLLIE